MTMSNEKNMTKEYNKIREEFINNFGIRIFRIQNEIIEKNIKEAANMILTELRKAWYSINNLPLTPSFARRGKINENSIQYDELSINIFVSGRRLKPLLWYNSKNLY